MIRGQATKTGLEHRKARAERGARGVESQAECKGTAAFGRSGEGSSSQAFPVTGGCVHCVEASHGSRSLLLFQHLFSARGQRLLTLSGTAELGGLQRASSPRWCVYSKTDPSWSLGDRAWTAASRLPLAYLSRLSEGLGQGNRLSGIFGCC